MLERVCWGVLALIHATPFAALFAPAMIERLYGVAAGGDVFPLLHHRAALFGCIFIACAWAVFQPGVRQISTVLTALSMLSFLAIYMLNGSPTSLRGIALADVIGLPFLLYAGWRAFNV